jgi:hypothetical protein
MRERRPSSKVRVGARWKQAAAGNLCGHWAAGCYALAGRDVAKGDGDVV